MADEASHHILNKGLSDAFPHIPIISEEHTHDISVADRQAWSQHWLVDPLDGSKEFIKKNIKNS